MTNVKKLLFLELIENIQFSPHPPLAAINASTINSFNMWISQMMEDDEHFTMPIADEDWIPQHDFFMLFWVKKTTFNQLVELVGRYYKVAKYRGGKIKPLTIENLVMIFLWFVSKGSSMNTI